MVVIASYNSTELSVQPLIKEKYSTHICLICTTQMHMHPCLVITLLCLQLWCTLSTYIFLGVILVCVWKPCRQWPFFALGVEQILFDSVWDTEEVMSFLFLLEVYEPFLLEYGICTTKYKKISSNFSSKLLNVSPKIQLFLRGNTNHKTEILKI